MPAAKHTGVLGKDLDGMLDEFVCVNNVGFGVRDVQAIAAGESDPQHNLYHGHAA